MTSRRAVAALIAGAVALTIGTRIVLSMAGDALALGDALWSLYRFFTVITNTLIAVVCLLVAVGRGPGAQVQAALLLAIAMVGIVYHLLLAHLLDFSGLDAVVDQMLHTVIPIAFALYWVIFAPKSGLRYARVPVWLLYPSAYCVYALMRGAVDGVYPYPFLDIGAEGASGVAVNVAALFVVLWLAGLAIVWIGRQLPATRA